MTILEHDPKDLEQGLLRLGREFKSEPIDYTKRIKDVRLVPMWKQTGKKPIPTTKCSICEESKCGAEQWLWDNGYMTKCGLDVHSQHKGTYYVVIDGRALGAIFKGENSFVLHINCFYAFHHTSSWSTKKEAILKCLQMHSQGHEYR